MFLFGMYCGMAGLVGLIVALQLREFNNGKHSQLQLDRFDRGEIEVEDIRRVNWQYSGWQNWAIGAVTGIVWPVFFVYLAFSGD